MPGGPGETITPIYPTIPGVPGIPGIPGIPGTPGVATPVPEPETWAMLLVGLGILGLTARRRKAHAPR